MARVLMMVGMSKLLGTLLLIAGAVMLYLGWRAHESMSAVSSTGDAIVSHAQSADSVWLLTLGAVAAVWGRAVVLRRRV